MEDVCIRYPYSDLPSVVYSSRVYHVYNIYRYVKGIIENYLQEHTPISPTTMSALIKVVDDFLQAIDKGHEVCVIFFDVHKAFNTVLHLPLLQTLEKLGFDKYLLRWLNKLPLQQDSVCHCRQF